MIRACTYWPSSSLRPAWRSWAAGPACLRATAGRGPVIHGAVSSCGVTAQLSRDCGWAPADPSSDLPHASVLGMKDGDLFPLGEGQVATPPSRTNGCQPRLTGRPSLRPSRSADPGRSPPRTPFDTHVVKPVVDRASAIVVEAPVEPDGALVLPLQLLTVEMLRRPPDSASSRGHAFASRGGPGRPALLGVRMCCPGSGSGDQHRHGAEQRPAKNTRGHETTGRRCCAAPGASAGPGSRAAR